ncbi:uncharacterized protein [Primulina eburnea]|uniref:uncharacterized protein isoform X1 n=1 Tax=Primulina eburnea TaxID=1245227 RepID=UPI003C6C7DF1
MASEGKTVGKPHFQHQDKANTQSRIMIANHAARSSKKVGLARELGSMNDSGKEVQNIQGMLNNQMDGVSKHQHNDLQGMTRKSKFVGKSHFQLRDEEDTQPRIISANHATRNSNKRECQNIQDMPNNQKDKVSKQQHNDVQGKVRPSSWNRKLDATFNSKKMEKREVRTKKKYYDPELPMQVLLEERDKRAFVEQYVKLVAQWNSEKSKESSEKNKIARNQKIMNQTTGRRSFAQVQQKLKKEKGRPPSRVELFHACFTHANGSPSGNIVAEKLDAMKELEN